MICVECNEPTDSLYVKYTNDYIKLTDCSRCSKVADKYIEFDNVILFIDTLLLKPQAYRHIVFNFMSQEQYDANEKDQSQSLSSLKSWFEENKKVNRIRLLMILFEIYLTWAYEEKNYINSNEYKNPYLIINTILTKPATVQYLFFSVKCILDDLITHTLVPIWIFNVIQWKPKGYTQSDLEKKAYYEMALSLTILLSGSTKLFPILMLIWPYNNITITNIISSLADLNLIEALKIVTGCSSIQAIFLFVTNTILKFIITRGILICLLSNGNMNVATKFANNEYMNLVQKVWSWKEIIVQRYGDLTL
ncbi:putative membrane protein [Wickerhamomyces ciferrii]|uniref:Protein ARV n=1 Tax=Wickerhamomyces ciferrii (strain ATCC 14091 / BCRC 22168 / CBS 111 / JCM 3599 / NBRC 0793 / NRRL Y-1031 F-60-10) TaxID=1206466 RepID=K0KKG5_WICCF|nr:uncharacterized protein BN7_1154 [Wickerhamomyces ciferrii]CCH41613.1 putative membrane protein [Wickerhamomyces ciferrii]